MGVFHFKRFSIRNESSAMKVNSDAVVFGAWINLQIPDGKNKEVKVLDIGTGTGVIALMAAQRLENIPADIMGIDIDPASVMEAQYNFSNSPWVERIKSRQIAFQDFSSVSNERFDIIFSNPPYFRNSLKAPDKRRSDARHSDSLPYTELIEGVKSLLAENGRFSVILPYNEVRDFILESSLKGLYTSRECMLFSKEGAAPKRLMMEFVTQPPIQISHEEAYLNGSQVHSMLDNFYL